MVWSCVEEGGGCSYLDRGIRVLHQDAKKNWKTKKDLEEAGLERRHEGCFGQGRYALLGEGRLFMLVRLTLGRLCRIWPPTLVGDTSGLKTLVSMLCSKVFMLSAVFWTHFPTDIHD